MSTTVKIKSVFDERGIKNAEKAFGGLGSSVKNFGGILAAALGGAAVLNFAKDAVMAASNLSAEFEGVNQTFGTAAESVQKFATEAAQLVGVSETVALRAAKNFGGFATAAGLSGQSAADFSINLVKAAGDLASFADVPVEEAIAAINSGLTGSAEPLQKFQIFLDATTLKSYAMSKGLGDSYETMTQGEKTLLRQSALLDQMGVKSGDFVNYSTTFGNSIKTVQAQFADMQAELGKALLPALEILLAEVQKLVPVLEESLVNAIAKVDFEGLAETLSKVIVFVTENIDEFIGLVQIFLEFAPAITGVVVAYGALKVALTLATAAQLIFNSAVMKNPYVILAVAIVTGIALVANAFGKANEQTKKNTEAIKESSGELTRFNNLKLSSVVSEIDAVGTAAHNAGAAIRAMNTFQGPGIRPDGSSELNPPSKKDFPLNPKPGQVFTWYKWENVNGQTLAVWYTQTWSGTAWSAPKRVTYDTGGSAPAEQETAAERFAKVQEVIKRAQAAIRAAEQNYAGERFRIQQQFEDNVLRLQEDAASRQLDLVNESKSRITDAFKSASRIGLSDLFDAKTSRVLETTVRQLTSRLTVSVTRETEKTALASVDTVIKGLRDRLNASKTLLENASQLASEGFSQTFIEEVISAGTETGNALADAIMRSAPETRTELKDLYEQLETVGETGAQGLADNLFNTFGLATRTLRDQSALVAQELKDGLEQQNKDLAASLAAAAASFGLAITDIKNTFLTDLAGFDGWFAGLGATIDQLLAKMGMLSGKALTETQQALTAATAGTVLAGASVTNDVAINEITKAQGLVIDSMADVSGAAAYLEARVAAAERYIRQVGAESAAGVSASATLGSFTSQLASLQGAAATGQATGTVININVKTDTTQSRAMVGKTIGNIVTKYVTTGGQVLVSGSE
jgi:hypothetical protein